VRAACAASPPPMERISSSLEDLATVPEASTSKETATVESKSIHSGKRSFDPFSSGSLEDEDEVVFDIKDDKQDTRTPHNLSLPEIGWSTETRQYAPDELESRVLEAVKIAKKEWQSQWGEKLGKDIERAQEAKINKKLSHCKSHAEKVLQNHGSQQESELQELKVTYELKLNEQKDKAALANRLAKMRLEEIERMEAEMKEFKSKDSINNELDQATINKELKEVDFVKLVKGKEVEALKKEFEGVKEKMKAKEKAAVSSTPSKKRSRGGASQEGIGKCEGTTQCQKGWGFDGERERN
jgi:hypothetical protein